MLYSLMLIESHIYHRKPSELLSSSSSNSKVTPCLLHTVHSMITLYYLSAKIGSSAQIQEMQGSTHGRPYHIEMFNNSMHGIRNGWVGRRRNDVWLRHNFQ